MKRASYALAATLAVTGCATPSVETSLVSAPGMKRQEAASHRPSLGKHRPRHPSLRVSRSLRRPPVVTRWSAVADCESSDNWRANTGNGYFGGLQEDLTFWQVYGGLKYAVRPDLATKLEQVVVAERGLAAQGASAWPVCGRFLRDAA